MGYNMNPIVLISLLAAGCAAAPADKVVALHSGLPLGGLVATHSITHQVPSAVELKQVGDVVPVAAPLAHVAVPGYSVNGEIRTVDNVELKHVPLVAHTGVIAHHGLVHAPLAVAPAVVKADEEDKTVAVHSAVLPTFAGLPALHHAGLPIGYHGLGLGLHGLGLHGLPVIAAAAPAAEESEE